MAVSASTLNFQRRSGHFLALARHELGALGRFAKETQAFLEVETERQSGTAAQDTGSLGDLEVHFPSYLRLGVFLAAYAILEDFLHRLCTSYHQICGAVVAPNELRGRGIERSKLYLKKVVGISHPKWVGAWEPMGRLAKLRNKFAHQNGILSPGDQDLEVLQTIRGVQVEEGHYAEKKSSSTHLETYQELRLDTAFLEGAIPAMLAILDLIDETLGLGSSPPL